MTPGRQIRGAAAGAFALAVAGACVPARDNPYDSQNAPDAGVRVVDLTEVLTPEARECALVTDSRSFLSVATASRGRCLALEAFGDALEEHRFFLVSTGGSAALDMPVEPVVGRRVALPEDDLRRWPVDVPLAFELRGRDRGGNHLRARTSIVLLNTPPVVVSDPLRVLPEGGFEWAPGAPFLVTFSGDASHDADRDPVDVCFRFPGSEQETCRVSGGPPLTRMVASTSGTFVAEMWARDSTSESPHALSVVRVGTQPAWINAASGAGRLDPERDTVALPVAFAGLAFVDAEPERIAQIFGSDDLLLIDPDTRTQVGSVAVHPDGYAIGIWDPSRELLWAVQTGINAAAEAWRIESDQLIPDRPRRLLPLAQGDDVYGQILDVDADGDLWIAPLGSDLAVRTAWGTAESTVVALPAPVSAIAVRPDADGNPTEEVWALVSDESGATVLRIEDDANAVPIAEIEDGSDCGALAWIDESELWLVHPVRGALRIDADRFVETGLLDAAILMEAPIGFVSAGRTDDWRIERDTRSLVLVASIHSYQAGRTLRVSIDGRVESSVGDDNASFRMIDSSGRLWYSTIGGGGGPPIPASRVGRTTGKSVDLFTAIPLDYGGFQRYTRSPDRTSGGYWALSRRPSIVRVFSDGRFEERAGGQDSNGTPIDPPSLGTLSVSPDGTTAWALAADGPDYLDATGLYRIDLQTAPPTYVRMPFDPPPTGSRLAAFGPDGAFALYSETSGTVELLASDGARTPYRTLGVGESGVITFDATATGGACIAVAYDDAGTDSTRIEWIDGAGAPVSLGVYPRLAGIGIPAHVRGVEAVLAADGSPVCWLLRGDIDGFGYADLSAWDESGLLHERLNAQLPVSGAAAGPHAAGPDDVWITDGGVGEVGNATTVVHHFVFDPAGPFLRRDSFTENGLRELLR